MCELLHTSLCGIRIFKADRLSAASLVTAEATVRAPLSDSSNRIALAAMGEWPQASRRSRGMPDPSAKSARSEVERRRLYSSANSGGARSGAFMSWPNRICPWRTLRSRSISIATISPCELSSRTAYRSRMEKPARHQSRRTHLCLAYRRSKQSLGLRTTLRRFR